MPKGARTVSALSLSWSASHVLRQGAEVLVQLFTLDFSLLECWGDFSPGLQSPWLPGTFGGAGYFFDSSGACVGAGAVHKGCWGRKRLDERCARLEALVCERASPWAQISWVSASLSVFVSERLPESFSGFSPEIALDSNKSLQTDLDRGTKSLGLWGRKGWGIVMRQQRGWQWSTAIGQERRNRFKLQEGDFKQDTSKSQWQELSVCWLPREKEACYFGESLRITCLPRRTGERLVLGKAMTDGSLCPLQPSQLWLYIP